MQLKGFTFYAALVAACLFVSKAQAQHSDIEFGYDAGMIEIEPGHEGLVFEGDFPTSGLFERFTTSPGFGSEIVEGLGIGAGDIISYNILDNLYFWSLATEDFDTPGSASIDIDNAVGPNTLVTATSGAIIPGGAIGQADGVGEFHSHVGFTISAGAPLGAYGLLMELVTDASGIAESNPFFIVFNYGLDEDGSNPSVPDFEDAVLAFSNELEAVPEPSSIALATIGCAFLGCGLFRRRSRRSGSA